MIRKVSIKNEDVKGKVVKNDFKHIGKAMKKDFGKGKVTGQHNFVFDYETKKGHKYTVDARPTDDNQDKVEIKHVSMVESNEISTYRVVFVGDEDFHHEEIVDAYGEEEAANIAANSVVEKGLDELFHDYYEILDCTDSGETVDEFAAKNGIICLGDNGFYFRLESVTKLNMEVVTKQKPKISIVEQIFSSEKHYIRNIVDAASRDKLSLEKMTNDEDSLFYYVMDTVEAIDEYIGMYDSDIIEELDKLKEDLTGAVDDQRAGADIKVVRDQLIQKLDNIIRFIKSTK